MTGKQLKMWSWETVRRNWIEPAETENLSNSQKCLITLHIVGWVIIRDVSADRRCFPVYIALRYLYGPADWTGFPTIDLFSERIDKIRGQTHRTSSVCAAFKLNTVERSDDLSNKGPPWVRRRTDARGCLYYNLSLWPG